jgi:uncharacterized Rossmann fold enzyme
MVHFKSVPFYVGTSVIASLAASGIVRSGICNDMMIDDNDQASLLSETTKKRSKITVVDT